MQRVLRPQTLDTGKATVSTPASTNATLQVLGTQWPLTPHQRLKIWNVSAMFIPNANQFVIPTTLAIGLLLFDSQANPISPTTQIGEIVLAAAQFAGANSTTAGTISQFNGASLAANGRPLLDLAANFLIANLAGAPMPAFVQIAAWMDYFNSNSVATVINGFLAALLSWE